MNTIVIGLMGIKSGPGWEECPECHRKACSPAAAMFGFPCNECRELVKAGVEGDFEKIEYIEDLIGVETDEDLQLLIKKQEARVA